MTVHTLIDVSAAFNQRAGIGRYARELTRELIPLLPPHTTRLWYAADRRPNHPELINLVPWSELAATRCRISRRNVDRISVRTGFPLRKLLGSGNPDVSYSPDFTTPPGSHEHVTIHDLAWHHQEAQTPPELARYLTAVVNRAIERADTIFTVSASVRAEILGTFGLSERKVVVASNAAGPEFFTARSLDPSQLEKLGIRRPFLLFVGTVEPRKNLPVLLKALASLPAEFTLVVVGKDGWKAQQQLEFVHTLGLQNRVVRPGFVSDQLLPGLYASATAVVYPSHYEGFGLPVVEGLAAGAPVIAPDLPIFREVGGAAVEFFETNEPESLALSIQRSASSSADDHELHVRRQAQARKFDWHSSAVVVAQRLAESA